MSPGDAKVWGWDFWGPDHFVGSILADPELDLSAPLHPDLILCLGPSGPASIPSANQILLLLAHGKGHPRETSRVRKVTIAYVEAC